MTYVSVWVRLLLILKHSQYVNGGVIFEDASADQSLVLSAKKAGEARAPT